MATIKDIAEAVKGELNGGSFSQPFTAERHYLPAFELTDMKTLHVTVVPKGLETSPASRGLIQHDYQIDVAVQKKLAAADSDEIDALMVLVEEISDFFRQRFLAESRSAARLIHPNVVQIFDAGEERGNPYIVMEYVEGATVKQLINTRKRLGLSFVVRVISEAAQGLAAAHKLKLVHRDVKPENIMISFNGETKVMDFGLAKDVGMQGDVTKAGMLMGTPYYMAPEQFMTDVEVDHRADIYALGVTLYHMLAGKPPYIGDSPYKIMTAHLNEKYKPIHEMNAKVPEALADILNKMLAKRVKNRYQNMPQVVKDLERVKIPTESPASQNGQSQPEDEGQT